MHAASSSSSRGYEKMQQEDLPLYPNIYPAKIQSKNDGMDTTTASAPLTPAGNLQAVKPLLGPSNTVTSCPFCLANIKTSIKHTKTTRTHIASALCCLVAPLCCLGCWICCSDSAKNADHYCPNCERFLGTYEK